MNTASEATVEELKKWKGEGWEFRADGCFYSPDGETRAVKLRKNLWELEKKNDSEWVSDGHRYTITACVTSAKSALNQAPKETLAHYIATFDKGVFLKNVNLHLRNNGILQSSSSATTSLGHLWDQCRKGQVTNLQSIVTALRRMRGFGPKRIDAFVGWALETGVLEDEEVPTTTGTKTREELLQQIAETDLGSFQTAFLRTLATMIEREQRKYL